MNAVATCYSSCAARASLLFCARADGRCIPFFPRRRRAALRADIPSAHYTCARRYNACISSVCASLHIPTCAYWPNGAATTHCFSMIHSPVPSAFFTATAHCLCYRLLPGNGFYLLRCAGARILCCALLFGLRLLAPRIRFCVLDRFRCAVVFLFHFSLCCTPLRAHAWPAFIALCLPAAVCLFTSSFWFWRCC